MKKVHLRDLRLRNNAGIEYPCCQANGGLIDLDKPYKLSSEEKEITCKHCQRAAQRKYPWAMWKFAAKG